MQELESRCIDAGINMTSKRRAVLSVLDNSEDHPSVEMVYERARKIDPLVSMATVYRTLNLLDECGIVIRHDFKENFARYELNDEHHDHLIDLETGKVIEFQDKELERVKKRIAKSMGFDLIDHRLELYGKPKPGRIDIKK
jgi:Fur family ferric uptake transcriptional regulator